MKYLLIFVLVFCQGCILVSDAKYKADEAMWQAKSEASRAWATAANKPLATFTAVSGETFTVNNPNQLQPMAVTGEPSAIVQGADVILNSTVAKIVGGGWSAGYMLGKVQGNYKTGDNGTISVTRDSNNPVDVTTRHIEGDGTISESDDTATPTVVEQPEPIIVNPAEPVIIEQPEPIIVNQPEPVIVNPIIVGDVE